MKKIYIIGYVVKDHQYQKLGAALVRAENEWDASEKFHLDQKEKGMEIIDFFLKDVTQKILEWFRWK